MRSTDRGAPGADRLLLALVFASGAAGLAYEVSWSRQLGSLFGQTARASAIVLAAYFLGMGLGYALAGRRSGRTRRPLVGYAAAELVVAGWAFVAPVALSLAPAHVTSGLARVVVALGVLLPGTTALGASLPFVAQAAAGGRTRGSARVARIYAVNLAGAVVGVALSTVMLAPVGVVATSWVAAATSAAVGLLAWRLRARFEAPPRSDGPVPVGRSPSGLGATAAFLSGVGVLASQVLYVRLFSLVFHNSTYTFAAILMAVLVALALAAAAGARILRWIAADRALVGASATAAATLPLSVLAFVELQGLRYFGWGDSFAAYLLGALGFVAAFVAVPMLAMGLVLPLAWHLAGADDHPGAVVGRLTTANTLGGAVGATAASFVLLPALDLWASFAAVALLYVLLGRIVAATRPRPARALAFVALAGVVGLAAAGRASQTPGLRPGEQLLTRFSGPYGWIDVTEDEDGYHRSLRHNIHYGLGSRASSAMQLRQGQFPLLLHPEPARVAFVGMATGVTASAALGHPDVEQVTVMELVPEVVEAARFFDAENGGLLTDPRVEVRVGDGRSLLGADPSRYDVIVSDLFVPWESKTGYLYTVEHFEAVRDHLAEGGVFCQWLAGWQVGPDDFESIVQSLSVAFPHVTLWQLSSSDKRPLFALVAVDGPRALPRDALVARMAARRPPPRGREDVLVDPDDLADAYLGDWRPLDGVPLNTDEHPVVEFSAPRTHRSEVRRLRDAGYRDYHAARLQHLPRAVFTFEGRHEDDQR